MKPLLAALLFAFATGVCVAAPIYSCVDSTGKKLTSDRPIPECSTREQRLHNRDGSVKGTVGPTMTADERAAFEAREAEVARERVARSEALRRDRNLLQRFPNEAVHHKSRDLALDDPRRALKRSEARLEVLAKERKPLQDETEFYATRQVPPKLKQQMDANDASVEAQRSLIVNQQAEIVRINALYDAELDRLKKLWAGAQPGTLGALPAATVARAAASAPPRR